MQIVCLEGNIGAGKTTLLYKLKEVLGDKWEIIPEPADTDPEFARLLNAFTQSGYSMESRVAFQTYITESRANLLKNLPDGNYIVERSLMSDLTFLTQGMLEQAMKHPDTFSQYMNLYHFCLGKLDDYPRIDKCIYLRTLPAKAYQRMLRRGRAGEKGTPMSYLEDVSCAHEFTLQQVCRLRGTDLITVNGDNPTLFLAQHLADRVFKVAFE